MWTITSVLRKKRPFILCESGLTTSPMWSVHKPTPFSELDHSVFSAGTYHRVEFPASNLDDEILYKSVLTVTGSTPYTEVLPEKVKHHTYIPFDTTSIQAYAGEDSEIVLGLEILVYGRPKIYGMDWLLKSNFTLTNVAGPMGETYPYTITDSTLNLTDSYSEILHLTFDYTPALYNGKQYCIASASEYVEATVWMGRVQIDYNNFPPGKGELINVENDQVVLHG